MNLVFDSGKNYMKVGEMHVDGTVGIEIYEDFQGTSCYRYLTTTECESLISHLQKQIEDARSKK